MPSTKIPTTFAELEAEAIPGRPLSGPALHARRLAKAQRDMPEAECVRIAYGVSLSRDRTFPAPGGLWTTVGAGAGETLEFVPG